MREPHAAASGEPIDGTAARLVLLGVLEWRAGRGDAGTGWTPAEWGRFFAALTPREAVVCLLVHVRGLTQREVGEWLGVSRAMVDNIWRGARAKLRAAMPGPRA